jgi:hypothetical protein
MQAYLQRNYFQGVFKKIRFPLITMCLKMNFKVVFYKVFPLMSKDYFVNPISNIHYARKPLWPIYKALFAN